MERPKKKETITEEIKIITSNELLIAKWANTNGYNHGRQDMINFLPGENELWNIMAKVNECKKDKEDCTFNHCQRWATCKLLVEALSNRLEGSK